MNEASSIFEPREGPSKELRVLAAFCYFPFGFVLPYFLGKHHEPFVLFHLRQAIGFFIVLFIIGLLPISGIWGLGWTLYLVIAGWTGYKAYQWEVYMLGFVRSLVDLASKYIK